MIPITNFSPDEIESLFTSWQEGLTRARKVSKAIFQLQPRHFDEMMEVSKRIKNRLREDYYLPNLHFQKKQVSSDGTIKFLFKLQDENLIESVLIPDVGRKKGKRTLCLSTQVGCAMGCKFCLTGVSGLKRNLETWEIIEQYREIARQSDQPITHLVFMGMGEPLHNYKNLLKAIQIFSSVYGANISQRKITVSTSGMTPQLVRLAKETNVLLAVTLSAASNSIRSQLMPINKKYPLEELIAALKKIPLQKRKRIFIEYVLLKDINDHIKDAEALVKSLRDIPCKVNLIPFNEIPGFPYKQPSKEKVFSFLRSLRSKGLSTSIRTQRGQDILAACGQLSNQIRVL